MYNPVIKRFLYLFIDFLISFSLFFNTHGVVPHLIVLRFYLSAPTRQVEGFFFTSKILVTRHSGFLARGFLSGVDFMGDIVLLSVNHSGLETISASRISLNCCWSSHLPACLYNFLMFSINVCSYRALLLKYWSISMVCT